MEGLLVILVLFSVCVIIPVQCDWVEEMENPGFWQGDVLLDPDEDERRNGTHTFASIKGYRWPNGEVPYIITSSIGAKGVNVINNAISNYIKYTCLRFRRRRTNDKEYLRFFRGSGCYSPIGYRQGRVNQISLASGCWYTGIVMHEIGHSIGLFHEQSRPDRDDYVKIMWENINSKYKNNFVKQPYSVVDSLGTTYDYLSMMHYGPKAFGGGRLTIKTKNSLMQNIIGQRKGFSEIDKQQLGLMYNKICRGGGATCINKKKNCDEWKNLGYCNNRNWKKFMASECCMSCKNAPACVDKKGNCRGWTDQGYCNSSEWKAFMSKECCSSCKVGPSCADNKSECSVWFTMGHCSSAKWRAYMRKECCGSCRGTG